MDIAAGVALAVLIFAVLGKVLSLPFRIVWKLITN
ncbi:MAG: transcriptional regulator, partial [Selenomonas sp.]|nr:transcriptional regulator [Selenomonas sp.]